MSTGPESHAVVAGQIVAPHALVGLDGAPVPVPDPARLVHLQFRRFAGCPICDLHLRSFAKRDAEVTAAGIREVVVFHSTAEELRKYESNLPFAVIPDPTKALYREFGVESSPLAMFKPGNLLAMPGVVAQFVGGLVTGKRRPPPNNPTGGRFGLPADLLIASDGRVLAAKYGRHPNDNWSVDDLLARVPAAARAA